MRGLVRQMNEEKFHLVPWIGAFNSSRESRRTYMTRFVDGSIVYPQETIVLQGDVQGSEVTDGGGGRKFGEQRRHIGISGETYTDDDNNDDDQRVFLGA